MYLRFSNFALATASANVNNLKLYAWGPSRHFSLAWAPVAQPVLIQAAASSRIIPDFIILFICDSPDSYRQIINPQPSFISRYRLQPSRYVRRRNLFAAGIFVTFIAGPSHSIFRPAWAAMLPSRIASVKGPA